MPQLDVFIFSHIIIEGTIAFLLVALIIWNTAIINLFTCLKTRIRYLNLLTALINKSPEEKVIIMNPSDNMDLQAAVDVAITDYIKIINDEK